MENIFMGANEAEFSCCIEGGPEVQVVGFLGSEAISTPFHFSVDVVAKDDWLDADQFLGTETVLTIEGPAGPRYVHGMLVSVLHLGRRGFSSLFRLEVAPQLWYLSYVRQSRIFQDMTTPDILAQVIEGGGVPPDRYRFALTRDYSPRNYCVQYRESDLDFIHRLMEDEGMFYFFEQAVDGHMMVIADDSVVHVDLPDAPVVPYREPSGMVPTEQSVSSFDYRTAIGPDRVTLRDYSFKQPVLDVSGEKAGDRFPSLEQYDYPGAFVTPELGETFAEIRLGAHRVRRWIGRGGSDCRNLNPGFLFTLTQHPDDECNCTYLLTRVRHQGRQPQGHEAFAPSHADAGYSNQFEVIPAEVTFRPPRRTPRPAIPGVQTATVMGPDGEEIYTDQHGRIKVMFHWDRATEVAPENRSCWIRVAQPWAGNQFGVVCVPRVGQEVVVQFLEGDPNRPLVTGVVYNGQNPAPYGSPDSNTISTLKSNSTPGGGGFNEFRFEDAKGEEEVFLHAQRDLNETVLNNQTTQVGVDRYQGVGRDMVVDVGRDRTESVFGNMFLTVQEGDRGAVLYEGSDRLSVKSGNRTVSLEQGNHATYVAKERLAEVGGGDRVKVHDDREVLVTDGDLSMTVEKGKITIVAKKNLSQTSDKDVEIKATGRITIEANEEIVLAVAHSKIKLGLEGVTIEGPEIKGLAVGRLQLAGATITMN